MKITNKTFVLPVLNKSDFFEFRTEILNEKNQKQIRCEWKGYVKYYKRTVDTQSVEKKIRQYLEEIAATDSVREFLQTILNDQELLAKTRFVEDCSYVNGVHLVRPDGVLINDFENLPKEWEHSEWDGLEGIKFFKDKVEFFHLSLSEETWVEINEKHRVFFDTEWEEEELYIVNE